MAEPPLPCTKGPELVVTRTRRSLRIGLIALTFVVSYLSLDVWRPAGGDVRSSSSAMQPATRGANATLAAAPKVRIFYNLFAKSAAEEERVRKIVEEQLGPLDAELHDTHVSVTSIGHRLSALPGNAFVKEHHDEGGEDLTLRSVWEYCKSNPHPNVKVVYLHSKGSYHPNESNHRLRSFVTQGALSKECASLPEHCNICSSRMSPLPHPHTSGNMWLARCDYVARLIDPMARIEGRLPQRLSDDDPCNGRGRYLSEHWAHSHPSVRPCDLYPGIEFTWAHLRVPKGPLKKELVTSPRFRYADYVLPGMCMAEHPDTLRMSDFVRLRKENYALLYNITELDGEWWGWEFLQRSIAEKRRRR